MISAATPGDSQAKNQQDDLITFIINVKYDESLGIPNHSKCVLEALARRYKGSEQNAARREMDDLLNLVQDGSMAKYVSECRRVFTAARLRGNELSEVMQVVAIRKGIMEEFFITRLDVLIDMNQSITAESVLEWLTNTDASVSTRSSQVQNQRQAPYGKTAAFAAVDAVENPEEERHIALYCHAIKQESDEFGCMVKEERFTGNCYWCGKVGHRVVNCPEQLAGKVRTYNPPRKPPGYGRKFYPRSTELHMRGAKAAQLAKTKAQQEMAACAWSCELTAHPDDMASEELVSFMRDCGINETVTLSMDELCLLTVALNGDWCVDSGATKHIIAYASDFEPKSMTTLNPPIYVGGLDSLATAQGSVMTRLKDKKGDMVNIRLTDVLLVPALSSKTGGKVNKLLSVKKIVAAGGRAVFAENDSSSIEIKGSSFPMHSGSLYVLPTYVEEEHGLSVLDRPTRERKATIPFEERYALKEKATILPPLPHVDEMAEEIQGDVMPMLDLYESPERFEPEPEPKLIIRTKPPELCESGSKPLSGKQSVPLRQVDEMESFKGTEGAENEAILAHRRLGHPSPTVLKKMVPGINLEDLDPNCDVCNVVKSTKNPARSGSLVRANRFGECWNIDFKGRIVSRHYRIPGLGM